MNTVSNGIVRNIVRRMRVVPESVAARTEHNRDGGSLVLYHMMANSVGLATDAGKELLESRVEDETPKLVWVREHEFCSISAIPRRRINAVYPEV